MAYETKVILTMVANYICRAKTLKQVYDYIAEAAKTEGIDMPSYDEKIKKLESEK